VRAAVRAAAGAVQALESQADRASGEALRGKVRTPLSGAPALAGARATLPGGGQALDVALRRDMEARFEHDFSRVRVHADGAAARAARHHGAEALVQGHQLFFGAGRWSPQTPAGTQLLAHELAHVVQQERGVPGLLLKASDPPVTRNYEPTRVKIEPPGHRISLVDAQAMTALSVTDGKLTAAAVRGATPGSDEEILLHFVLAAWAQVDRWDTEIDIVAPIGFKPAAGGAAPRGKVTVRIDAAGKGEAALVSTGEVVAPAPQASVDDAKKTLKTSYGLGAVSDGDASWTLPELNLVIGALQRLPSADVKALKDVTLLRVSTIPDGDSAGEFESSQKLSGTEATSEATLKLADDVFPASDLSFVGGAKNAAASGYLTVLHEVGHAIEAKALADTTHAQHQATAARNALASDLNTKVEEQSTEHDSYSALADEYNGLVAEQNSLAVDLANARKGADKAVIPAAQAALDDKRKELSAKRKELTTQKAAVGKVDKAYKAARGKVDQALVAERGKAAAATAETAFPLLLADAHQKSREAGTSLRGAQAASRSASADSSEYRQAVAQAGKDLAAAADAVKSMRDPTKDDKSAELIGTAEAAMTHSQTEREAVPVGDSALAAFDGVQAAQQAWLDALKKAVKLGDRTRRVHRFMLFVTNARITPFTQYARDNWPDKPGEFYAEAYSLFIADPEFLKRNQPLLHGWFAAGNYK